MIFGENFVCWEAGKIFSIQQLDLNLSQQDLQKFWKSVKNLRFYVKNEF